MLFRLPADRVDIAALRPYLGTRSDVPTKSGRHYILQLTTDSDDIEPDDDDAEIEDMAGLVSLRAGLLNGDMRLPYVAWLLAVQADRIPDRAHEPPVPAGLCPLPGPLAALADLLGLDEDLLQAAAEASTAERHDPDALRRWIAGLSPKDKDYWLLRSVEHPEHPPGSELLAAFRRAMTPDAAGAAPVVAPRVLHPVHGAAGPSPGVGADRRSSVSRGRIVARAKGLTEQALDALVEEATVDAYGESEQMTGLFTLVEERLTLPFTTEVLGVEVVVVRIRPDRVRRHRRAQGFNSGNGARGARASGTAQPSPSASPSRRLSSAIARRLTGARWPSDSSSTAAPSR